MQDFLKGRKGVKKEDGFLLGRYPNRNPSQRMRLCMNQIKRELLVLDIQSKCRIRLMIAQK
jgi:hypothetical protein